MYLVDEDHQKKAWGGVWIAHRAILELSTVPSPWGGQTCERKQWRLMEAHSREAGKRGSGARQSFWSQKALANVKSGAREMPACCGFSVADDFSFRWRASCSISGLFRPQFSLAQWRRAGAPLGTCCFSSHTHTHIHMLTSVYRCRPASLEPNTETTHTKRHSQSSSYFQLPLIQTYRPVQTQMLL